MNRSFSFTSKLQRGRRGHNPLLFSPIHTCVHSTCNIHAYQDVVWGMLHGSSYTGPHTHRHTHMLIYKNSLHPCSPLCARAGSPGPLTQLLFSLPTTCYRRCQLLFMWGYSAFYGLSWSQSLSPCRLVDCRDDIKKKTIMSWFWSSITAFFFFFKLQTDGRVSKDASLSHINQMHTTTLTPGWYVPP